jgi:hypothetical protein
MNRDEAMGKILGLLASEALEQRMAELEREQEAKRKQAERKRDSALARREAAQAHRRSEERLRAALGFAAHVRPQLSRSAWDSASLEQSLLLEFTPESAYAFLYARTVPPATEDGLALIACYPELAMAAPELVEDLALAFRHKLRGEYAAHFARVAAHHGLELNVLEAGL